MAPGVGVDKDGYVAVGKKASGNSWGCNQCMEWNRPARTECFVGCCNGKKPKNPRLLCNTKAFKEKQNGKPHLHPSQAKGGGGAQGGGGGAQSAEVKRLKADLKKANDALAAQGGEQDDSMAVDPAPPLPAAAVKAAQASVRQYDAYLKGLGGVATEAQTAEKARLAKAVDDAKAAVTSAKAAATTPDDRLRAAMDRADGAKRKMDLKGIEMVKCREEQEKLVLQMEEINKAYFDLGEELRAAEEEREVLQLQARPATTSTTGAVLRSYYDDTIKKVASSEQAAQLEQLFQQMSIMFQTIEATAKAAAEAEAAAAAAAT